MKQDSNAHCPGKPERMTMTTKVVANRHAFRLQEGVVRILATMFHLTRFPEFLHFPGFSLPRPAPNFASGIEGPVSRLTGNWPGRDRERVFHRQHLIPEMQMRMPTFEKHEPPDGFPMDWQTWMAVIGEMNFTPKQIRIVELVLLGRQDQEIADAINSKLGTVQSHLTRVYQHTNSNGRLGLVLNIFRLASTRR